jgi:hypothetical protein
VQMVQTLQLVGAQKGQGGSEGETSGQFRRERGVDGRLVRPASYACSRGPQGAARGTQAGQLLSGRRGQCCAFRVQNSRHHWAQLPRRDVITHSSGHCQ